VGLNILGEEIKSKPLLCNGALKILESETDDDRADFVFNRDKLFFIGLMIVPLINYYLTCMLSTIYSWIISLHIQCILVEDNFISIQSVTHS